MRGDQLQQVTMLSTITPDQFVPTDHPIRRIKVVVEEALRELSPTFDAMYSKVGRPSIPPERLLKASILMALYSVRSERQFCERLHYDLLFKWFLDMNVEDPAFDPTTFSKNRERLLDADVAKLFFVAVLEHARLKHYVSSDHFTVDGTLLDAWASFKSFKPKPPTEGETPSRRRGKRKGRNPHFSFRGKKHSNETHKSTTDPDARLARKGFGKEARICLSGHVVMENRCGLVVDVEIASPSGYAEREVALKQLKRLRQKHPGRRLTVGGDKGYDTRDFVEGCRELNVTPHVARNVSGRRSAIDERTVRHEGYAISQKVRKRVEEIFGWTKTVGGGRKLRYVGVRRNQLWAELTAATYNLVRIANMSAATA